MVLEQCRGRASIIKVYSDVQGFRVNRCAHIWFLFYFGKDLRNSALPKSNLGFCGRNHGQVENSEITETSESDFPMFPFPSFRLRRRVYSKTRKMKARKVFSEISEKSEFSNCHF